MVRPTTPFVAFAALLVLACFALPAVADTSSSDVKKAFKSGEKGEVSQVLKSLEGQLDKGTVRAIVDNAVRIKSLGVYDALISTLRTARGEALEELNKQYKRQKRGDVRFLILDGLGPIPEASAEETLVEALEEDKDEPVQVLAARLLAKRHSETAVDALIPLLADLEEDASKERLVREVNAALQALTGQEISVAQDWKNYWGANRVLADAPAPAAGASKTKTVMDRMREQRPSELKSITRVRDDEILVIKGNDKCEDVLEALTLKHQVHERDAFDGLTLDPIRQILILNCPGSKEFTEAGIQKVRAFVAQGGYLFCSDWELKKTLAKAFPEAVTFLTETERGDNTEVRIVPVPQTANHPLMRDVFPLNSWTERGLAWNLHQRSHLAKPSQTLVPLIACPDVEKFGTTTVAFTFGFTTMGGGRPVTGAGREKLKNPGGQVLWVSSHFKDQKDESGDGFALQQLLLNFVLEKQEQRKVLLQKQEE